MWRATPRPRYLDLPIDVASSYQPYALIQGVDDDFGLDYFDMHFARHATFGDDGLLEHLEASWSGPEVQGSVELSLVRCGGVVLETARNMRWNDSETTATYYYYGCDDFVLPAPPPLP